MSLPVLVNEDIVLRLSGGSANVDPKLSKGGIESTTAVDTGNILHNLFDDIDSGGAGSGITKNRLVYVHNNSPTNEMKNVTLFMLLDSESLDTSMLYGLSVAGVNEDESAIVLETDDPPGVTFKAGVSSSTGINLGTLPPGGRRGVWIRLAVNPGAEPHAEDKAFIRLIVDPGIISDIPGGGGGGQQPDIPAFSICVTADCSCSSSAKSVITKMKARNPNLIFLNGDLSYKDGVQCLKDLIGSTWLPKTKISLGNHDVDESHAQPRTYNDAKATFSMPADYYTFSLNNLFCIVMDSEISSSPSSNQYKILKPLLEAAAGNSAYEWIIVFQHRPIYSPDSDHPQNENNEISNWHNIFDINRVTFVITGHNHNMWRSYPIKKGSGTTPTITNSHANEYTNPLGEVFIGMGAGGRSHYDFDGSIPSWAPFGNDNDYGYLLIEFYTSIRKAVVKFFTLNDTLLHTFTIIHGGESKYVIPTMTALGNETTDVPANANDNNMATRWTHASNPSWIKADLGTTKPVSFVEIAWFDNGSSPVYTFEIEYSTDDIVWTTIVDDRTNTILSALERYSFPNQVSARYIRVNVKGNSIDNIAAMWEFDVGVLT